MSVIINATIAASDNTIIQKDPILLSNMIQNCPVPFSQLGISNTFNTSMGGINHSLQW